jgi:hypothetical protein
LRDGRIDALVAPGPTNAELNALFSARA